MSNLSKPTKTSIMTKNVLVFLFLAAFPMLSCAQNGGSALRNDLGYVSVEDNSDGSLDKNDANTIEMWIRTPEVVADQKLFSKITDEFKDGYILGIQDGSLRYETFNNTGTKSLLIAGTLVANQWTHIAATYVGDDKMRLYINGELVGETNVLNGDNGFIADVPLIIGTAGWDLGVLTYQGEIEELRFWHESLPAATIKDWMHRRVTDNHPAHPLLRLYHRYDETGAIITDHSPNANNPGTMSGSNDRTVSSVPFKNNQYFAASGPAIGGIWSGQESYTLEGLRVTGNGMTGIQSTVFETNTANLPICGHVLPAGIDAVTCLFWAMVHQENPILSFNFDLTNYDISNYRRLVLMESDDIADFTNAKIIEGTLNGNSFDILAHAVSTSNANVFYAIGFENILAGIEDRLDAATELTIAPNPSSGFVQLNIETKESRDYQLQLMDYSGKVVLEKQLRNISANYTESFDWSSFPKGLYVISLSSTEGISTRKLVLR